MNSFLKSGIFLTLGLIAFYYVSWYNEAVYYLPCTFGFGIPGVYTLLYLYAPFLLYFIPGSLFVIGVYFLREGD